MWFAMAGHAAWNFLQSIVFGLPNSGTVLPYYVFRLDSATARNSVFYDAEFGLEGAVLATIILAAGCVILYKFRKEKEKPQR